MWAASGLGNFQVWATEAAVLSELLAAAGSLPSKPLVPVWPDEAGVPEQQPKFKPSSLGQQFPTRPADAQAGNEEQVAPAAGALAGKWLQGSQ